MTLDFIGGVIVIAAVVVNISVFSNALGISQWARIGLVTAGAAWTGLQLSLYAAGAYQSPVVRPFPLVGPMVVLPPIIVGIAAMLSSRVRATLLAVPTELLIGLNAIRVFGGFFVVLAAVGRLSGPFPYFAGWGDVIVGLTAIPLAMRAARGSASPAAIFALERLRRARSHHRRDARHAVDGGLCHADLHRRPRLDRGAAHAVAADPDCAGSALPHHARNHLCAASAGERSGHAERVIAKGWRRPPPLLGTHPAGSP